MIAFLQALLILGLVPMFELDAQISKVIERHSQIDEALFRVNEALSSYCHAIKLSNTQLRLLEMECILNVENPVMQASIQLKGLEIAKAQETMINKMQLQAETPNHFFHGRFIHPQRGPSMMCDLPGQSLWRESVIARFKANTGGATNRVEAICHWEYLDESVQAL